MKGEHIDLEEKISDSSSPGHADISQDPDADLNDVDRARVRRALLWKLDLRLIPWLSFLYLISFLDRTNIGNARLEGMEKDLHLTPGGYTACLSIFFVSYALAEPLTNVLLRRFRPSVFIPAIMVLWGICMTSMGLCHNYSGLMAARFFLGLTEAGLFPGINFYLSCWYKRDELGIRAAIFFSAAALSGSFGGLLAAAIAQMDGIGGKAGWSWIFILEGLATILVGIASLWLVYDFPDTARFLSDIDRKRVIYRLKDDQQSSVKHQDLKLEYLWQALKDWKTYTSMFFYMGSDGALYAFSLFLPTIINDGLGYKHTKSQLLSVPPYALAAINTVFIGYIADRTKQRGLCNMASSMIGVVGFAMLLSGKSPAVQYVGTFLGAMGIYPTIPNTISWVANNSEGAYKRGITIGIVNGWGNLNGIVSSNIYRAKDKPTYRPGHAVVLAYLLVFLVGGSGLHRVLLKRENDKRLAGKRDYLVEGKTESEIEELGDQRPGFIYTL